MSKLLDIADVVPKALKRGEAVCLAAVVRGKKLETLLIKAVAVGEEWAV